MARARTTPAAPCALRHGLLAGAVVLLGSASASAYCRTTTCDPDEPDQDCTPDRSGCVREGEPLYWSSRCIHFATQKDGSPRRGISYAAANAVIREAFITWAFVDCGGWSPSISIYDLGEPEGGVECDLPEYNDHAGNANVWMFRDDDWPYEGASSTLALTTITFEVPTGKIVDADVEVNSQNIPVTVGDDAVDVDLASIATHEAGHFLGLSHTNAPGTTMYYDYAPGDISLRLLDQDDIDGMCAIYPRDRDAPDCSTSGPPIVGGFSTECAPDRKTTSPTCATARVPDASRTPAGGGSILAMTLGLAAIAARSRLPRRDR